MRYQDPSDVSCGVQALGMAMGGLGGPAPSSNALLGFLQGEGMMYDFGTGVEELAYAAQSFGYKGSVPFHDWSLEQLRGELVKRRPVVVSLGANGEGLPGHFVTVTGISPDGKWVTYNDPTLGKQVVSAEEFSKLWGLQGNSGVAVRKEPAAGTSDATPWVAMAAGLMAAISTTPLALRRKGTGGRLIRARSAGGSSRPPYPAPPGHHW
ncbi:MAG: hypothetical protein GTO14_18825, partial [Anaerolineales bacterium]|nr:hypothetical protein [Anaerolineales bacterium]